MIKLLALDIAMKRTGWAVGGEDSERPHWGVFETVNWSKKTCDVELKRWWEWLDSMAFEHRFNTVTVEQVFVDNRNGGKNFNFSGTQAQMMLSGVLFCWAAQHNIETFEAGIDGWRARALGLNRKPKDHQGDTNYWKTLALKVMAQRNWFCEHHDEAEALCILDFSLAALSKPYRLRTEKFLARQHQDFDLKTGAHT